MKKTLKIMAACALGYLMYPFVQSTNEAINNPDLNTTESFYVSCILHEHFEAFSLVLLKVENTGNGQMAWLYGRRLGLPPKGKTVNLRIDRIKIPFLNGYLYLNRARSDELVDQRI
jgi:hypothetical protein